MNSQERAIRGYSFEVLTNREDATVRASQLDEIQFTRWIAIAGLVVGIIAAAIAGDALWQGRGTRARRIVDNTEP